MNALKSYQKAALAIAVIVALADTVIVYDLWLAGSWMSTPFLSAAKTAAFVLLFVGSLIAEMQELSRAVRLLLLAGVVILGGYQALVNVVVNYHAASIPVSAMESLDLPNFLAMALSMPGHHALKKLHVWQLVTWQSNQSQSGCQKSTVNCLHRQLIRKMIGRKMVYEI
jgi:hypothetical protein